MEFQQLEMFAAVVEEGSLRRAADRVFRTAPAVSIALKKLEEEIGTALLTRSDRNQQKLTASGQLLYSYSTRILNLRREAVAGLQALAKCQTGTVRIGANESTSLYLLPKLIHAFQEAYPASTLEATSDNSDVIITALKQGRIDLAVVASANADDSLQRHLIMRDEIVLIVTPNHHLTKLPRVGVKDLAQEVLIAENAKSSLHDEVLRAFNNNGTEPNVRVANVSIEGIKRMVSEGVGIGFVPLMCVQEEKARGELATIRVDGVSRQRELWLVRRDDDSLSPPARAFIKVTLKLVKSWNGKPTSGSQQTNKLMTQ
jgi:DNA-binding transcriptional LysR family regulator